MQPKDAMPQILWPQNSEIRESFSLKSFLPYGMTADLKRSMINRSLVTELLWKKFFGGFNHGMVTLVGYKLDSGYERFN